VIDDFVIQVESEIREGITRYLPPGVEWPSCPHMINKFQSRWLFEECGQSLTFLWNAREGAVFRCALCGRVYTLNQELGAKNRRLRLTAVFRNVPPTDEEAAGE